MRAKLLKDFIEWTVTEFTDVWYVTNQDLIKWMKQPVPLKDMQEAFPCVAPPVDLGNKDICDGIDNDSNGVADDGLTETCMFTGIPNYDTNF
jgi:hypothetical protein